MIFLRNLLRAPVRSLMTTLGVGAGLGLFVAVKTITVDVRRQIGSAAAAYQLEVVAYERRATSPFSSRITIPQMAALQTRYGDQVTPLVLGTHNETWNAYALIIGVPPGFLARIQIPAGEPYATGSRAVLIGEVAAERLGVRPGDHLQLDGGEVSVSGVFRTGSRMLDGGLMMDLGAAQRILTREGADQQYTLALFRAGTSQAAATLMAEIGRDFPALKAIPGAEFAGALRLMRVVDAFVRTLAVVAIVGTGLVVGNAFLMSLAERTRELGILMTVGWSPWLVLRMLAAESLVLCAFGALLGNLFAMGLLRVVNGIESIGFGWIPVRYPVSLAAASLALAGLVAIVALAWPAVVVFRMQPLAALRHD